MALGRRSNRRLPDREERAARAKAALGALGRALWRLSLLAAGLAALATGGRAAFRWATSSPTFAVNEIAVDGASRLSAPLVRQLSGLSPGENVFRADLSGASQALLGNPWIRSARVVRELPRRLRISIDERRPVAEVELGGLYLVDEEGEIFKRAVPADGADLPVITGIGRQRFAEQRAQAREELDRALELLGLLGHRELPQLSEIHVDELLGLTVYLGPGPIAAKLGWDGLPEKLDRLERARRELSRRRLAPATIDLSNDEHPERVDVALAGPGN